MKEYLQQVHGFDESNITVLMDDGEHTDPTRANILDAYRNVVSQSQEGDVVFCHFSGKIRTSVILCAYVFFFFL